MGIDPRVNIVDDRLSNIKRLIGVSGGKGGVGKSLTASVLALTLSDMDYRVGLLDLDLSSPSIHVILDAKNTYPIEDRGIVPSKINGIEFMSIVYFTSSDPIPFRGDDISNAVLELLTITRWGTLDYLIVDMPPGLSDVMMDVIRWMRRIEFLIVTTPSKVALETVKKEIDVLKELKIPIIGFIENMKIKKSLTVKQELERFNIPCLGEVNFDINLEDSIGDIDMLLKSNFSSDIRTIVLKTPEFKI